ncbi:hypothetical protein FACS1894172_09320 [Spirochaetia bacterium]|nr:hypothetical protein FACS1894164_11600 [Spirochaetia bacterium]GHU32532.1 hypothetical protein FACS1894172_09320 [Spirochaetia bacterium]
MTHTTSEIVTSALELSQLAGSNILSYNRILYLVNSVYDRIYDFIVDKAEDYGSIDTIVHNAVEVPQDLLKIRGIYRLIHRGGRLVEGDEVERTDHEPRDGQYFLQGDTLFIGDYLKNQKYILRYYPKCKDLTIPRERIPVPYDHIYGMYASALVNGAFEIHDLKEDTFNTIIPVGAVSEYILVNGLPIYLSGNEVYDHTNALLVSDVQSLFQDKWSNYAYGYIDTAGDRFLVDWNGTTSSFDEEFFYHRLWGQRYRYDPETHELLHDLQDYTIESGIIEWIPAAPRLTLENYTLEKVIFSDPYIAEQLISNDGLSRMVRIVSEHDAWEVKPLLRAGNTGSIELIDFDHNDQSGYGVIYELNGTREMIGFLPDTLLDYPRTAYYHYFEAELARLFLIEARQADQAIDQLATQYWAELVTSIAIQNNYAYRLKKRRFK